MVKGVSRQVIVVRSPDPKLFEQAIFILRTDAESVSEEALLKEARQVANTAVPAKGLPAPLWAVAGAVCTAALWLLTVIL